ncbi:CD99 antigen-like protein 2 isoform X1 [Chanos chanos]|uniref:CD99 antigen-like protein 2 n=1 Tax=Chanos chanos TaxID=29144 RepID=A0A6J2VU43_CHACN|nr:CD99 antigen-like protein 2 isoform X1 [Chanos chanos]
MGRFLAWTALTVFSLLAVKVYGQDLDLSDALDFASEPSPTPKPNVDPAGGTTGGEGKTVTKAPVPSPTKDPVQPKPKPGSDDFDLSDALDPKNDIGGKGKESGKDKGLGGGSRGDGRPSIREGNGGGQFSDDDLADVGKDDGYTPDKGRGGRGGAGDLEPDNNDYDTMAETGTIAGIVSAVAMALVGAVTSYISYQKKKLCFSIQQSLNADMVKAENPEAVVAQEPQVQQTLLQPPNAEPPTEENAV